MKRILTVLILLLITGINAQTYTHNSKVRVKNTDTAADTDNLVTIDANGLLKRSTQTVSQITTGAPTLDNVLTAGKVTTQIPRFSGGLDALFGVYSNTTDFSRASNSLLTVRESSTGTGTTVSQFIDVTRANMDESMTGQVFGLVSRVVNTSDETNRGLIGANLVGRQTGEGNLEFVYGSITQADVQSESEVEFLAAETLRTNITGTGAAMITNARGLGADLVLNNPSANVTNLQAMHPSIQLTNGTVTDVTNLFLDLDWDNTGSTTVIGDISYIRAGNDALPTPTGNTYFIKSETVHPSEFAGLLFTTQSAANITAANNNVIPNKGWIMNNVSGSIEGIFSSGLVAEGEIDIAMGDLNGEGAQTYVRVQDEQETITLNGSTVQVNGIIQSNMNNTQINSASGGALITKNWFNSNSSRVLNTSSTDLVTTNTGVNDQVYTYTIPANTLQTGDVIKLRLTGEDTSGNTTAKTIQFQLAGQTINVTNFISTLYNNNQRFIIDAEIIVTGATSFRYSSEMTVQRNISGMNTYGAIFEDDRTTGTFNIANTNNVTIDLNNSTNGDLVIKTVSVKLCKQ